MSDSYVIGNVYTNIRRLEDPKYRGISWATAPLDVSTVLRQLADYGYLIISGTRTSGIPAHVVLFAPDSKYASKTQNFKTMLAKEPLKLGAAAMEIMFVNEDDDGLPASVKRALIVIAAEHPHIHFDDYGYMRFIREMPLHVLVALHTRPSAEEVRAHCERLKTTPDKFAKMICKEDMMACWMDLRPGDVVKLYRTSESAATAIDYRYCV